MTKQALFLSVIVSLFFAVLPGADLQAQVRAFNGKTSSNSHRLVKDVPVAKNPQVRGDGRPTSLYVVQLARFEDMEAIPSTFPKGTFLWNSHDHLNEKILFAGYYSSLAEARAAAEDWKKVNGKMFPGAFARPIPFIVRYD